MTHPRSSASTAAKPHPADVAPRRFAARAYPAGTVPRYRPNDRATNPIGTAGFVLGILGVALCWVPIVGVLCGLLGVIFGGFGIPAGRRRATGTGVPIAGVVLGALSLIPAVIILIAVVMSA